MLDEEEIGHLGVLEAQMDGETAFSLRMKYRLTAREGYVHQDCSDRAARAILRKAAPIPGPYRAGDLVCFRREQRKKTRSSSRSEAKNQEASTVWSTPARIIGFEGKTVWVLCEGLPVATAEDKLRPCTGPEVLAHEVLSRGYDYSGEGQQRFLDHRRASEPDLDETDVEYKVRTSDGDEVPIEDVDHWEWIDDHTIKRIHVIPRNTLFDPRLENKPHDYDGNPVDPIRFNSMRKTEMYTEHSEPQVIDDDWRIPDSTSADVGYDWIGETTFTLIQDRDDVEMRRSELDYGHVSMPPRTPAQTRAIEEATQVRSVRSRTNSSQLLDQWTSTGTVGPGVDLLRQTTGQTTGSSEPAAEPTESMSGAALHADGDLVSTDSEDSDDDAGARIAIALTDSKKFIVLPKYGQEGWNSNVVAEFRAFFAERYEGNPCAFASLQQKIKQKRAKEKKGKLINFQKADSSIQRGLLASRETEWKKWMDFHAGVPVQGKELEALIDEGYQEVPMQWIDVDKNESLRTPDGPPVDPKLKSRLVVRGDLEQGIEILRSDSPTCDVEAQNLIFSFAASNKLVIKSVDITNAYFQGEAQDRLMLLRPPPGGLPGFPQGARLLARVPIYGTKDAGRKFWKRLRSVFVKAGFEENRVLKALYQIRNKAGEVIALCGTHVDDIIWAATPEGEKHVQQVIGTFKCGAPEERNFRFCGKEVAQDDNFDIKITCRDTTKKLVPIRIKPGRKNSDLLSDDEKTQMKSVAGSLAWITRQARPDLCYRTSKIQQLASTGRVSDIKFANKVVKEALLTCDLGITFRSESLDWNDLASVVCTDASHSAETIVGTTPSGEVKEESHRSQGGRLQMLCNKQDMLTNELHGHLIGFSSTTIKRVCRSTIQAEAYQLTAGVEEGDRLRAAIAHIFGKLDPKHWESSSAAFMPQIWFTDCRSVRDSLVRPVMTKMADKRLSIEFNCLRQNLWREVGEEVGNPTLRDEIPLNATDTVRWIDTDVMLADPLTKSMDADKLNQFLISNTWDLSQPVESVQKKRAKQLAKRKKLTTYEHVDKSAKFFKDIPANAPCTWQTVVRRVTSDLVSGDVIDDDHKITQRDDSYKFRELPKGPRKIRTIWYFDENHEDTASDENQGFHSRLVQQDSGSYEFEEISGSDEIDEVDLR